MADIKKPVDFSKSTKKIISEQESSRGLSHNHWGIDSLLPIRKEARTHYRMEQKGICAYCKSPLSIHSASNCQVEHIVPKSLHIEFMFTPKNLCVVCADCNEIKREQETLGEINETLLPLKSGKKRKKYPSSSNAFKIVHPHFDIYDDHILIVNGLYVDKGSKKGNFTIGACNLNRKLSIFGWDSDIINEDKLIGEMNNFIDEKDSVKRAKSLKKIKNELFNL